MTLIDDHTAKITRLNRASVRKTLEPEEMFDFSVPCEGLPISANRISIYDHPAFATLTEEQQIILAREEIASMLQVGVRMEAVLQAQMSLLIARFPNLFDPRVEYMQHEIAEETRHSRAFVRMAQRYEPKAVNPFLSGFLKWNTYLLTGYSMTHESAWLISTLVGEEFPDIVQHASVNDPNTEPLLKEINRYHILEESRHLSFAKMRLIEAYPSAGLIERFFIRYILCVQAWFMFALYVNPGVYAVVGLPKWRTWWAAQRLPKRRNIRVKAMRKVLDACLNAGVFRKGHLPWGWRYLCGVDKNCHPID